MQRLVQDLYLFTAALFITARTGRHSKCLSTGDGLERKGWYASVEY